MRLTPARRLTLALGVPVAVALIGWTSFEAVALAGTGTYRVSEGLTVHNGTLNAHITDGSVTLVPGSTAHLSGTVTYSLIRPVVNASDSGVDFSCPVPAGDCSFTSTLTVPPSAAVNLSTTFGDLSVVGGIRGNLTLSTDAGNVSASGVTSSDVFIHSGAGDVSITFATVPSNVNITSSVGDISIDLPSGASYHVVTSDSVGNVSDSVQQNNSSPHLITVTSSVGDISIGTS